MAKKAKLQKRNQAGGSKARASENPAVGNAPVATTPTEPVRPAAEEIDQDKWIKQTWSKMDKRLRRKKSKRELQLFRAGLWTASLPANAVWSRGEMEDNRELCTRLSGILNEIGGSALKSRKSVIQCVERLRSVFKNRFYCEFAGRLVGAAGYREYFRTVYNWLGTSRGKEWFLLGIEFGLVQLVSQIVFEQQFGKLGSADQDLRIIHCGPDELRRALLSIVTPSGPARAVPKSAVHLEYRISVAGVRKVVPDLPDTRLRLLPCLTILQRECADAEEAHVRLLGEAGGFANYLPEFGRKEASLCAIMYSTRLGELVEEQLSRPFVKESLLSDVGLTRELLSNLVDEALDQAAAWSRRIPSLKTIPWITSGSNLAPSSKRQPRSAL